MLEFLFIKFLADLAVDLVVIELIQPLRGYFITAVELAGGFIAEFYLLAMAFFQSFLHPVEHIFYGLLVFRVERVDFLKHLHVHRFLPHEFALRAVFIMIAVAVPVAALYLPSDSALAFIAPEYVFKERIVLEVSRRAVGVHYFLAPVE